MNKLKGVRMVTEPGFAVEGDPTGGWTMSSIANGLSYPALPLLVQDAQLYLERRGQYGPSEQDFGDVMVALFPNGLKLVDRQDWVRYGLLHQIVGKLVRYANNFPDGTHSDSLRDLRVYAAMLQAEDDR